MQAAESLGGMDDGRGELMKKAMYLLAVLLAPALLVRAEDKPDKEIQAAIDQFAANWNRHDAAAMARSWVADGDAINPQGRVARGQSEIAAMLGDEHAGPVRDSTMKITISHVRELPGDYAFVDVEYVLSGATLPLPAGAPEPRTHIALLMVEDRDDHWKFVSVRPYAFLPAPPH